MPTRKEEILKALEEGNDETINTLWDALITHRLPGKNIQTGSKQNVGEKSCPWSFGISIDLLEKATHLNLLAHGKNHTPENPRYKGSTKFLEEVIRFWFSQNFPNPQPITYDSSKARSVRIESSNLYLPVTQKAGETFGYDKNHDAKQKGKFASMIVNLYLDQMTNPY